MSKLKGIDHKAARRADRQAAADRNMDEANRACHNAAQTCRRFKKRGGLRNVLQNSGQAEVRAMMAAEDALVVALAHVRATRALIQVERNGDRW